jgi:hypothetical protein
MDTAAGGTANARIALKKELFVISGGPIDIDKIDQTLADSMPMQVYGESKQYAFRYDPKLLVGRDALIIARHNRMDGIGRSLAELPSFAFGRSGNAGSRRGNPYGNHLKKSLPREAREQETLPGSNDVKQVLFRA